jgi:trimethylamine--corrinoid protein Co-methyltransferase
MMIRGLRAGYQQLLGCGLNLFTEDECAEIHRGALDILNDAGLMILNEEAREIYYSHGCEVDQKTNIVKMPPYLVEEAIASAPSEVLLAARNPDYDVILGGNRIHYTNFAVAIKMLDLETGKVRESTYQDLVESAVLVDATPDADIFFLSMTPRDIPARVQDLSAAEAGFTNTSKHFSHAEVLSTYGIRKLFDMGVAVAGSTEKLRRRPLFSTAIAAVSPLQLNTDLCEIVIESARLGIPCDICSEPLAGATSLVTVAGLLVQQTAENLGGILLSQLTQKGAAIMYGSTAQTIDLHNGNALVGDPEFSLINAGVANMARYYNLPSFIAGG